MTGLIHAIPCCALGLIGGFMLQNVPPEQEVILGVWRCCVWVDVSWPPGRNSFPCTNADTTARGTVSVMWVWQWKADCSFWIRAIKRCNSHGFYDRGWARIKLVTLPLPVLLLILFLILLLIIYLSIKPTLTYLDFKIKKVCFLDQVWIIWPV